MSTLDGGDVRLSRPTATLRAGVIGLGMMGGGMASSLHRGGLLTAVYDLDLAAADRLGLGGVVLSSVSEVGSACDVVFVVVVDIDQVAEVLASLGSPSHRLVVGICSTVDADDVRRLVLENPHLDVVDVGIAGGPDAAAAGSLLVTVGAAADTYTRIEPALTAVAASVIHAGPVGAGMELKLVKNAISFMTMCAVHEGLAIAEELGIDAATVRRVVADSNLVDHFVWFPLGRPSARPLDPADRAVAVNRHFAAIADKDLAAAAAAADRVGVDHPVLDVAYRTTARYFLLPHDDSA